MPGAQKYQKVARFSRRHCRRHAHDPRPRGHPGLPHGGKGQTNRRGNFFERLTSHSILANSRGLFAQYEQTRAEFSVTILEENSSGWAKSTSFDIRPDRSRRARRKRQPESRQFAQARANSNPATTPRSSSPPPFSIWSASFSTILRELPCATSAPASPDASAKSSSATTSRCGTTSTIPLQLGQPFDGEGVPRQKVLLVDRGVPKNLVYARATAKKMKAKPHRPRLSAPQRTRRSAHEPRVGRGR